MAYLEGVMGVRSLPMVCITLRPHTQSPAQIPTPPYRSNQMGVGALDTTEPLSYSSQRATSGPIALLVIEESYVSAQSKHTDMYQEKTCLPDIVPSVSEGAKARCEYLQELEQQGDSWLVDLQLVLFQSQVPASFLSHALLLYHAAVGHCRAVAAVTVPPRPPLQPTVQVLVSGISLDAVDSHGVGGVAVVPPDGPLLCVTVADAVADLRHVELVEQVFVKARVFVDGVGASAVRISDHHRADGAVQTCGDKLEHLVRITFSYIITEVKYFIRVLQSQIKHKLGSILC